MVEAGREYQFGSERPAPFTRDALGRPLIPEEEKRRRDALELAVATFQPVGQRIDAAQSEAIIDRAKLFEKYIAGE